MGVCSEGEVEALFISCAAIPVNVKHIKNIQDSVGINLFPPEKEETESNVVKHWK